MSVRELVALGTGSQCPSRGRSHNGYMLRWDGNGILLDPGEGTQRQLIHAGVSPTEINHICITHFHGDHCLGLAGIAQRLSLDRIRHPVRVYFPASGRIYYDRLISASLYVSNAEFIPVPVEGDGGVVFQGEHFSITALPLEHTADTFGYRLEEPQRRRFDKKLLAEAGLAGELVGRLAREGRITVAGGTIRLEDVSRLQTGGSFAFVMDTRPCAGARELAREATLVLAEATFLEKERELARRYGHMTAREAATLAREAGAHMLALGHFSQRYEKEGGNAFAEEAQAVFPNVRALEDLERLAFPKP